MLPNLKFFNDVAISNEERIMATSSIPSLHQQADYMTGDDSGYEYGPRDGSRSAIWSLERNRVCVCPSSAELIKNNHKKHADEFKEGGLESTGLHVEVNNSAFEEHDIFTAGSRPTLIDIIEGTDSQLSFSQQYDLDCNSSRIDTAPLSLFSLAPSVPQPLVCKDEGCNINSELEEEEERIFHEVLDSIFREIFHNTAIQSKT